VRTGFDGSEAGVPQTAGDTVGGDATPAIVVTRWRRDGGFESNRESAVIRQMNAIAPSPTIGRSRAPAPMPERFGNSVLCLAAAFAKRLFTRSFAGDERFEGNSSVAACAM
jgi:hypothetical protein